MPLTKEDTLHAKGIAIIGMVMLHLFCRLDDLPYTPWIWIGNVPLIYYFGLFGDICVPIFCFCSGYAHYLLQEKQGDRYLRRIPGKLLRFLINYWIVVVLFSLIGLAFDKACLIPKDFKSFLGNFFLYRMSYNGAWWFVVTYILLLVLSPVSYRSIRRMPTVMSVTVSGAIYILAYWFRFKNNITLPQPILNWFWQQAILLGTSQFMYVVGMLAFKCQWPEKMRRYFADSGRRFPRLVLIIFLPLLAFVGHGVVQALIVAPFTASAVLASLILCDLPGWMDRALGFLGKHSTNIWLVHMFFYLTLFEGLVFKARYPIAIVIFMFGICIAVSCGIELIYRPIIRKMRA